MASLKQIRSNLTTVVAFAVIKQFRRAAIIDSVLQSIRSNDLIASGKLASPETSNSIIPSADDRWLVPRKYAKKIVSVRVYGSRLSDGTQFPASVKIKVDLGDYGLDNKYRALATDAPDRPREDLHEGESGYMIDRIEAWMEDKMDRGFSFYYLDNDGKQIPLAQGDRVNRPRAAYPIMRKLVEEGPEKVDFASAFDRVEMVLNKSRVKIEEATYFDVISPALRKTIETIF